MGFPSLDSLFLFFQARAATIAKTHKAIPPTKTPIPTIDPLETESVIWQKFNA